MDQRPSRGLIMMRHLVKASKTISVTYRLLSTSVLLVALIKTIVSKKGKTSSSN
jgi:hypothetical protein